MQRQQEKKNKDSADIKESTFISEWGLSYSFFVVIVVVQWNEKAFSLKWCRESVFSTVKLVKSKYCSIYTHERAWPVGALSKWTVHAVTNFGNADICRGVCANVGGWQFFCHTHQSRPLLMWKVWNGLYAHTLMWLLWPLINFRSPFLQNEDKGLCLPPSITNWKMYPVIWDSAHS